MRGIKVIVIITITFILSVIDSCCDCDSAQTFKYIINDITATNFDNSGYDIDFVYDEQVINKNAYGIWILILAEEKFLAMRRISFIQTTQARCNCPDDIWTPQDSIIAVHIYTENDFDDIHSAGSDISDYFSVIEIHSYNYQTLDDYFHRNFSEFDLNRYNSTTLSLNFYCYLMKAPSITGKHTFTIEAQLSNGQILTAATNTILQ
jgi:hypothetical protein